MTTLDQQLAQQRPIPPTPAEPVPMQPMPEFYFDDRMSQRERIAYAAGRRLLGHDRNAAGSDVLKTLVTDVGGYEPVEERPLSPLLQEEGKKSEVRFQHPRTEWRQVPLLTDETTNPDRAVGWAPLRAIDRRDRDGAARLPDAVAATKDGLRTASFEKGAPLGRRRAAAARWFMSHALSNPHVVRRLAADVSISTKER